MTNPTPNPEPYVRVARMAAAFRAAYKYGMDYESAAIVAMNRHNKVA